MKTFGIFVLLSIFTGNPFLALLILLLILFFAERRFIGVLPDVLEPWRRGSRMRQLKKEIEVNPANADAYLELGETYFRMGKYGQVVSFLEKAAGKMAGHPLHHFYLGAASYHLGDVERAAGEIKRAIEANPKASLGEPYVYLIKIYLESGKPEVEVEHAFNQLLLYGSPRTFYQAAGVFQGAGDKGRARRLFRETIESYEASRGALRRKYRRWAVLSKISLLSLK